MKSYKIQTTKDIYEAVTKDNVDDFLKDFEGWLRQAILVKEALPNEMFKVAEAGFTWNDDKDPGTLKSVTVEIRGK